MLSETHVLPSESRGSGVAQQARGRAGKWSLWRAGVFLALANISLWGLIILIAASVL